MKLYVKSREEAEAKNELDKPHIIISINYPLYKDIVDEDHRRANPISNGYTKEILFLYFSDIGRLSYPLNNSLSSHCVPFNKEMANQVLDCIERNNVEHIIIHCLMGISRSASMADAISMYFNLEKATDWPVVNTLVYLTMIKELTRRYG